MRKAGLSRQRVLEAALRVVDREGLDALSMRRLGQELGVEAMSLYRYVSSKAELLDGLHETILEAMEPLAPECTGFAALRAMALGFRAALSEHPRALPIFATRPAVTPASLSHVERALQALEDQGFEGTDALRAFQSLVTYVVGSTLSHYGKLLRGDVASVSYRDLPADEFPRLSRVEKALDGYDPDEEFAFGLDALLDGIRARRGSGLDNR